MEGKQTSGDSESGKNEDEMLEKQAKKQLSLRDETNSKGSHQSERKTNREHVKKTEEGQFQDKGNDLYQFASSNSHASKDHQKEKRYQNDKKGHGTDENFSHFTTYDLVSVIVGKNIFRESLHNIMEIGNVDDNVVIKIIKENVHIFSIEGEDVVLNLPIGLCATYNYKRCPNKDVCQDLHICKEYIFGRCSEESCLLGHNWNTNHNSKILKYFKLDRLHPATLVKLMSSVLRGSYDEVYQFKLNVCESYNSSGCQNKKCTSLHICKIFLNSMKSCDNKKCSLSHDMYDDSSVKILNQAGISTNETPIDILNAIKIEVDKWADKSGNHKAKVIPSTNKTHYDNKERLTKHQHIHSNRSKTVWAFFEYGDVQREEICYYSVENICRLEEKGCARLHCDNHFHWQVSKNGINWVNFQQHQSDQLEKQYCDPSIEMGDLPHVDYLKDGEAVDILSNSILRDYIWKVDFLDMKLITSNKIRYIRRLCTDIYNFPGLPSNTFIWYCLNEEEKYEPIDEFMKKKGSSPENFGLSEMIETKFKLYLKDPKQKLMSFKDLPFNIDFKKMQLNIKNSKTASDIRRRPLLDGSYFRK